MPLTRQHGEKIELDRRRIEHQIAEINAQLKEIEKERSVQRSARERSDLPLIALVGYTNAGKSTLMNRLLRESTSSSSSAAQSDAKQVFEANMLFATLDTSVRRIHVPDHPPFLLTDTVGFISDLPHTLVRAFRSTLSEVSHADLLLEVIDGSDPEADRQHAVTTDTLAEIGAGEIPLLRVFNKSDLCEDLVWPSVHEDRIYLSARTGEGVEELLSVIEERLWGGASEGQYLLPYTEGSLLHEIQETYPGTTFDYRPDGVFCTLRPNRRLSGRLAQYLLS